MGVRDLDLPPGVYVGGTDAAEMVKLLRKILGLDDMARDTPPPSRSTPPPSRDTLPPRSGRTPSRELGSVFKP